MPPANKRPVSFHLGPFRWAIEWAPEPFSHEEGLAHGVCYRQTQRIKLATSAAPALVRSTLLHEWLHAALSTGPASDHDPFTDEIEEMAVLALETALLELLTRPENARLVAWLQERAPK